MDSTLGKGSHESGRDGAANSHAIIHRFQHNTSILALAATSTHIYAGTQGGEILVIALETFEKVKLIRAHNGSVLGLCLSTDHKLLFSSAGDRIVNIWRTDTLSHVASVYSLHDIGDLFCVSYSSRLKTVYFGAQNTSIQWYDLREYDSRPPPDPQHHPFRRPDRFFDSPGPGGIRTPRPGQDERTDLDANSGRNLEIRPEQLYQLAHSGYVHCTMIAPGSVAGLQHDEILISGGGEGFVKLWSLDDDTSIGITEMCELDDGREEGDSILSIIRDGSFLFTGRLGGEVNVWDLESKSLVRILKRHDGDVHALAFVCGSFLSAAMDGRVNKYNQRYELTDGWKAHKGKILASTTISEDNRTIYVTGGNDDTIALWKLGETASGAHSNVNTGHDVLFNALRQFVTYRTVSADLRYKSDCHRGASYLKSLLKEFGATTELLPTDDGCNPVVYGRFQANANTGKTGKSILFYGHYDVVGAESKQAKWASDPFELQGRDGFLYGRGASDNKGPIVAAVFAAAEAYESKTLVSDIVFLIEGEEERGSRGFKACVKNNKNLLGSIDWILLANSYWLDDEVPCLTYGLRGVIHASVEIQSQEPDLHSGVDGSRHLDEPMKDMVMLLAKLTGPQGEVTIPNFYKPVLPITHDERHLYDQISASLLQRNPTLGDAETLTESLHARWREPTLTIHGIQTSGSVKSSIIPSWVRANVSLRLVPNQEAKSTTTILIQYLKKQFELLGSKNRLVVSVTHQADPWLGDYRNEIFKTLEHAVLAVWDSSRPQRNKPTSPTILSPSRTNMPLSSPTSPRSAKLATSSTLSGQATSKQGFPSTQFQAVDSSAETPPVPSPMESPTDSHFHPQLTDNKPSSSTSANVTSENGSITKPTPLATSSEPPKTPPEQPKVLYIREGGSIPAIRFLEVEFGAQAAHLPCGLASDNAHLDNERMRVLNLWNSKAIFKKVFSTLGTGN